MCNTQGGFISTLQIRNKHLLQTSLSSAKAWKLKLLQKTF